MLYCLASNKSSNILSILNPKKNFLRIMTLLLFFYSNNALAQQKPSCKTLPQFLTDKASPGVNCLADCNAMPSGVSANNGTNCLNDCNNMPSGVNPVHGNNCVFKVNGHIMPLCNSVPSITAPPNPIYFLKPGMNKLPRENCADLVDLPLCNLFSSGASNKKNCVKKCSELNPANLIDRVHNRDCIRFTSDPEADASAEPSSALKCHHYINTGTAPSTSPPCEATACTNLSVNELNKPNLYSQAVFTYKYCLASNKCSDYNASQLDAIKAGYDSATGNKAPPLYRFCSLHNCRTQVDSSCAQHSIDDTARISESSVYSNKYISTIITTISPSVSTLSGLCVNKVCNGVTKVRYPCTGSTFNVPDPLCPAGSTCTDAVCTFDVDCDSSSTSADLKNLYCNPLNPPQSSAPVDTSNSYPQLIDKAWFYLPKPMNKSYKSNNPTLGYIKMNTDNLCQSTQNMKDNEFGNHIQAFDWICFFTNFAYDHNYLSMDTRSPNVCDSPDGRFGLRGTSGWADICGSKSYASLPDMAHLGYIEGISSTWTNETSSHRIRVCLRYDNGMIPDRSCGARECGITCSCGRCSSVCGSDVCLDLVVKENDPRECKDPTDSDKACSVTYGSGANLDNYLRMRAVGFERDNRICVMFDWKGGLAYSGIFMNGADALPEDPTKCLSGTYDPSKKTCINGKNSNDDAGSAQIWRATGLIKYIDQNDTVGGVKGIKDVFGNFFPEANCIKRQLRASPPNLYNIANYENSPNLFSPPLIINKSKTKIGGGVSNPISSSDLLGPTDFNEPEVEILYGTTAINVSLGIGKNGNETGSDIDPNSKQVISTVVFGKTFTATVFAKKLYDTLGGPKFCVFRELRDKNNALIDPPPMIGCVKRKYPELDNCDLRDGNCSVTPDRSIYLRKFLLEKDTTPGNDLYNKIIVKYRYLVNYSTALTNFSCTSPNKCSGYSSVEFNLTNYNKMDYCVSAVNAVESYPICFQRDDCSLLNMECMANETVYSNSPDTASDAVISMQETCRKKLELCNNKKNIATTSKTFDPRKFNASPLNNYYGWFNEVCLYDGFNHKIRQVYAYKISGFNGKCIVMPPYNTSAACADGGKMPSCPCTIYNQNLPTPDHVTAINALNRTTRTETLHEAGLCVDITLPKTCPAIDYVETFSPPTTDPFFVNHSLNLLAASGYNNTTGVHTSHQSRTLGGLGNAEFNSTIAGNIARGNCNGYWKNKIMYGQKVYPELSCTANGTWNAVLENSLSSCERYSCPAIPNPILDNSNGIYSNNYGSHETNENKGTTDGFAYWPKTSITTDFATSASATDCIVGFKKDSSTLNFSYPASVDIPSSKKTSAIASTFGAITSYSSGTSPSRQCNQIGEWQNVTNLCVRISCPTINPGTSAPANADDNKVWRETWERFGGAKFLAINASRSKTEIITYSGYNSRQSGTCETGLGFYQPSGSASPTMDCDYLGNWTNLQNGCLNDCNAIVRTSTNESNGFATWPKVTFSPGQGLSETTGTCTDDPNYFNYPYPPRRKSDGTKYTLISSGTPDYITTIPEKIANDNRSPTNPKRMCTKSTYGSTVASQWSGPSSTCVTIITDDSLPNGCVSGDSNDSNSLMYDERIGAGVTEHKILDSTGNQITIKIPWQRRKFGQTQVRYCDSNNNYCQNFLASTSAHNSNTYYISSRSKSFTIARFCDPTTKKWADPVAYCIASGDLGNSLNSSVTVSASALDGSNHYLLGAGSTAAISCNSGYASASTPNIRCDANTNLNQYNLVRNDNNSCVKYCDTNSEKKFSGTTYTYLTGPSANTRYYSGNTATATCDSGKPCGNQTTTATCTDSGWSIPAPGCRACYGCDKNSGNNINTTVYTRTISNECVTERLDPKCLIQTAKSKIPSKNHGETIGIWNQIDYYSCYGNVFKVGRVCGAVEFTCNDGVWNYTYDHSHPWSCDRTNYYQIEVDGCNKDSNDNYYPFNTQITPAGIIRPNGIWVCCRDGDGWPCDNNICGK